MAEIEKKPVKIVETILRDAHQSLIATRMTTDQMMPIVEKMDKYKEMSVGSKSRAAAAVDSEHSAARRLLLGDT